MQILIIGKVWPEPKSSAAGRRMLELITFFKTLGEVMFVTSALRTGFEAELAVDSQLIKLNDDNFNLFLKELNPDIVVFDRFMTEEQFSWRVKEICPNALRVLNTEDLHFLRKARETALNENQSFNQINFDAESTYREIASIHKSDLTLFVSDFEFELINKSFAIPNGYLSHFPIFSNGQFSEVKDYVDRKDMVFVGNFLHSPNLDAVRFLKNVFWPLFRNTRKDIAMHIYGAYATQEVLEMNSIKEMFFVHGRADDVFNVMNDARICFAPLRFGAGIKGKIIDAMEAGLPVVTTYVGAEGLSNIDTFPGFISDDIPSQIEFIYQLYDNKEIWEKKQNLGSTLLKLKFNRINYYSNLNSKINFCLSNLTEHRKKSFESNLIQHQSFQNSKYFSKWISEKNGLS